MSSEPLKVITAKINQNKSGIPDMTGKSKGNFLGKTTAPNEMIPQKELLAAMTSISAFNYHPQPNYANANNYTSKLMYRTPQAQVMDMAFKEMETKKKDDLDDVLEKYQRLYEMEKKHQNDIATHTKYSLKDYDDGKKDKKHKDNTETRNELMKQIEDKQTHLLRKTEADRMYGTMCDNTLQNDTGLVSIYPPIKVTPDTDMILIKKQRQLAYQEELKQQIQARKQAAQNLKDEERHTHQKNVDEYVDKIEKRMETEKTVRQQKNQKCINECDTIIKTKQMLKRVEKDNNEFRYKVLHTGLYSAPGNEMKPMKDVPFEGVIKKLADKVDFPRAPEPEDHKAPTAKNVESGNVQWGLPLNSEKEQKRRSAAIEVDMNETIVLMKEIEDLKSKKANQKKSEDDKSPEKVTADPEAREQNVEDDQKGTLEINNQELTEQDIQDIKDLQNEYDEDGKTKAIIDGEPQNPSYVAKSIRPDGQNSIIPKKLNSKRLDDLNSQMVKSRQNAEADSIFEHKSKYSKSNRTSVSGYKLDDLKTKLLTATYRENSRQSMNDTKSLAQITKETLNKIQEDRKSTKDFFSTDKKAQAINSLIIKNKIGEYQSKLFGVQDPSGLSQKIAGDTTMNGAQLDALKRFFGDLEQLAINDKLKTDNQFSTNIDFDNTQIKEKLRKKMSRVEDDTMNLKLKETKQMREKEWRDQVYKGQGIEGNQGYPKKYIPSQEFITAQKLDNQQNMKHLLDEQVDYKHRLNNLYDDDHRKTTNQFFGTKTSLVQKPESMQKFQRNQRTYSVETQNQLQKALKISMDIQENKRQQQLKQMENIKDVWQKTQKIRQLRSMFTDEFGTYIPGDIVDKATKDPNRNKSMLSKEHTAMLKKEQNDQLQQTVAASIASKRAASSRGHEAMPHFRGESQTNPTALYMNTVQNRVQKHQSGTPQKPSDHKLETVSVTSRLSQKSLKMQEQFQSQQSRIANRIEANLQKQKEINELLSNDYNNLEIQSQGSRSTKISNFIKGDSRSNQRNNAFFNTAGASVFQKAKNVNLPKKSTDMGSMQNMLSPTNLQQFSQKTPKTPGKAF